MTTIALTQNSSTLILAEGYCAATETLAIQFRATGETYEYKGVDPATYKSFVEAESQGKFFHQHIKKNIQGVKV